MLERAELTAGLILFSILLICGISTIILDMAGKQPFATEYSPDLSEGTLVHLKGPVQNVISLQGGKFCILKINGVSVFLSGDAAKFRVQEGTQLSLYGLVQVYKGEKEIVVGDPQDIRIIGELSENSQHS